MKSLVGSTGFVGSNLFQEGRFDRAYHSKNIKEAYGTGPELLVYAGLRAEKYLANRAPEQDMESVLQAEKNISEIGPQKLVLISTIDVFKTPRHVDESSLVDTGGLSAYGYNRYQLECWVRRNCPDALIIRLPALFGKNIKKNFIYDFIHVIPFLLPEKTLNRLSQAEPGIEKYYTLQNNGFCRVRELTPGDRCILKEKFRHAGFSALNFTDSRSRYQFYSLERLWDDIQTALQADIRLWHPATEPVSAGELFHYLTGQDFINRLDGPPADYDCRTIHSEAFGGAGGYISSKADIMADIRRFVKAAGNESFK